MKTGYCPKCGNSCEVTFTPYVMKDGKIIRPKRRKFCYPSLQVQREKAA